MAAQRALKTKAEPPSVLEQLEKDISGWANPPARLADALRQNEFVLFAQPIVALRPRKEIALAEILIRLREEEEALLPPGMFLPVFEYYGIMHELDRWVAMQVIERLSRGARVPCLSLNVSAQTLGDEEFLPRVATQLKSRGVAASALAFEISEDDMLALPSSAQQFAAAARRLGMRVILASFGRSAASFRPLHELHAHYVKIDATIVGNLARSQTARNRLQAIVRAAEVVGAELIGECVESDEALAYLVTHGVRYAQGFGVRAPAPLDEVVR
jgi:EAL domain-containing protein (putative c-di-GMP-specific phosphodiesterase class I)